MPDRLNETTAPSADRPAVPGDWRLSVVDSPEELDRLGERWSDLFEECEDASLFTSWEWMSTWWRHYQRRWRLRVLVATDGAGRLVGIAPFVRRRRLLGPLPVRCLSFMAMDGAFGSHLDLVSRSESRDSFGRLVIDYFNDHRRQWDVIDVRGLASTSSLGAQLDLEYGRGWEPAERVCPYVPLAGDWEQYLQGLKKQVRRNLRYFTRLLEKEQDAEISFRMAAEPDEVQSGLDLLVGMHKRRRRDSTLGDRTFVSFHREFAPRALARGWLRLYTLTVGDRPIAVMYCLRHRTIVSAYLSAFDLDWSRYSPGRQIAAHAIRCAIEEGAGEFDWMQGDDRYKYEWTRVSRRDRRKLVARNARGYLWIAVVRVRYDALEAGRRLLTTATRHRLRQLVARVRHPLQTA